MFTCARFSRLTAAASPPSIRDKSPPQPTISRSWKQACLAWRTRRHSSSGGSKTRGLCRRDLARGEQTFRSHKTVEFPNASHFFFEDEADQMIPEIRAF